MKNIPLTLYSRKGCKRVVCERWVGYWTDCNILTPSSSDYSSTCFSFCWAVQTGVTEGRKPSVWSWFSLPRTATQTPTNWLQLTQAVCGTWLYYWLTYTCFLWASQLHQIQPVHRSRWYPYIFDRMHLFLDWRLLLKENLGYFNICIQYSGGRYLILIIKNWATIKNDYLIPTLTKNVKIHHQYIQQTFTSEFESHWVLHSCSLAPYLSKKA